jgi:hypothetical protein
MADRKFSMDDYVDVAERIQHFYDKHPDGSLQQYVPWETREVAGQTFIVYTAAAYRTQDDRRPGIGTAWEPFPGTTPYTRNSELMNAETAAWGRAIVALGLTANRKIASRQEVQARAGEDGSAPTRSPNNGDPSPAALKELGRQVKLNQPLKSSTLAACLLSVGAKDIPAADLDSGAWATKIDRTQVSALIDLFKSGTLPTGESDVPADASEFERPADANPGEFFEPEASEA